MQKVAGIGGIFFRAKDPAALAAWYQTHLGIDLAPTSGGGTPWMTDEGITVFAPFASDTDYFPSDRAFMLNFRVQDIDAMLKQLRDAGIDTAREETMDGVGRFARIHDPEGNPIELWEPAPMPDTA
jgi:glyoxylase I family protein